MPVDYAKMTDAEVDMLWSLRDEGWGYRRLSAKFEISKRQVRDILHGKRRGQVPTAWRKVRVSD